MSLTSFIALLKRSNHCSVSVSSPKKRLIAEYLVYKIVLRIKRHEKSSIDKLFMSDFMKNVFFFELEDSRPEMNE